MKVDLNCDMGESFGLYKMGSDEEMIRYISSANIACGYHGGDPHVMRKTVQMAKKHGVAIGAHPGFPDAIGFGRRYMTCTPDEIRDYVLYQVGALREFATAAQMTLQHCKPHGALYMMAMEDEKLARAILEGLASVSENMLVFALQNSAVEQIGKQMGMRVVREVYADREHTKEGSIVLTRSGPSIENYAERAARVVRMVKEGIVLTPAGEETRVHAETVCIHGDTPGAVELIRHIHEAFREAGITVAPIGQS
ncbi:MAG: LamB/YcsF family protein [Clostridia bacterium]